MLLAVVRDLPPRDRALITLQWFSGFSLYEVLSMTVGSVCRGGAVVEKIGISPRHLKGGYNRTR